MPKAAYLYIISDQNNSMIYIGVVHDLKRKIQELKAKTKGIKLLYYEEHSSLQAVQQREQELRGASKQRKFALLEQGNPGWKDLTHELGDL